MKTLAFASRNTKEMIRDKINLFFGLGFPLILLFLLSMMQANVPVNLFAVEYLTPGITVFGYSFISLFAGMIVAKDQTSSFMPEALYIADDLWDLSQDTCCRCCLWPSAKPSSVSWQRLL